MLHEAQTSAADRTEHREGGRRGDPGRLCMDRETDEGGGPICTPSAVRLHSKSPPPWGPRVHPGRPQGTLQGKAPEEARSAGAAHARPGAVSVPQTGAPGGARARGTGHGGRVLGGDRVPVRDEDKALGWSWGQPQKALHELCPQRRRVPRHDERGVRSCASRRNFFFFEMISDFVLSFKTLVRDPSMTAPGGTVRAPDWGRLHRSRWR